MASVSIMNWVFSMDTLEDEVVDAVIVALTAGQPELEKVHQMAAQIDMSLARHSAVATPPGRRAVAFRWGRTCRDERRPNGRNELTQVAAPLQSQRDRFGLPADLHYLNCAYMSPLALSVADAGVEAVRKKMNPTSIVADDFFSDTAEVRARFGRLVNAPPESIAIIQAAVLRRGYLRGQPGRASRAQPGAHARAIPRQRVRVASQGSTNRSRTTHRRAA